MAKARVFLVDDSATVREAVRPLFDSHPKFKVCGEAEHGREAVEKAPQLRPDLIVLDLAMPVMNGLEAAPLLTKILPNVWHTFHFPRIPQSGQALSRGGNTRRCSEKQSEYTPNSSSVIVSFSSVKYCQLIQSDGDDCH